MLNHDTKILTINSNIRSQMFLYKYFSSHWENMIHQPSFMPMQRIFMNILLQLGMILSLKFGLGVKENVQSAGVTQEDQFNVFLHTGINLKIGDQSKPLLQMFVQNHFNQPIYLHFRAC